jgi:hypothetical protein
MPARGRSIGFPLLVLGYFQASTNLLGLKQSTIKSVLLISDVLFSYFCNILLFKAHIFQKPNLLKTYGPKNGSWVRAHSPAQKFGRPRQTFYSRRVPSGRTCFIWPKRRIALRLQERRNGRLLGLRTFCILLCESHRPRLFLLFA